MGRNIHSRLVRRPGLMILALAALWAQLLVPQGFMISSGAAAPGLVICTGHGPLDLSDHGQPGKAPAPKSNAACVFAGHGLADTPTPTLPITPTEHAYAAPIQTVTVSVAPGQGLAAPPPPARGPPQA